VKPGDLVVITHDRTPLFSEHSLPGDYCRGFASSGQVGIFLGTGAMMALILLGDRRHHVYESSIEAVDDQKSRRAAT
jgi:hypothetical protein